MTQNRPDYEELERLHAAATAGEMKWGQRLVDDSLWFSVGDPVAGPHEAGDVYCSVENLAYWTSLHNAFPAILADVRRLEEELAATGKERDEARELAAQWQAKSVELSAYIQELLDDMPDKSDLRLRYREMQFADTELVEMQELLKTQPADALAAHDRKVRAAVLREAASIASQMDMEDDATGHAVGERLGWMADAAEKGA